MQRSRRALLQRRALENAVGRKHLYKLSLSLVILLWGLVFLLNLWISHGGVFRDEPQARAVNISDLDEEKLGSNGVSSSDDRSRVVSLDRNLPTEPCAGHSPESECPENAKPEENPGTVHPLKENMNHCPSGEEETEVINSSSGADNGKDIARNDRLTRVVPLALGEFKSRVLNSYDKFVPGPTGTVIHRMEPGGAEYNYASAAKGAKVLAFNKEAKGASNILGKDKDKYLRNPCSAEEKYVIIELSEETLVDTIEIANFEYYSSNLKDFELLGSLLYPTYTWDKLGNFTAGNVKHAQRFALPEPKWVRYLKLNLLSHYGSEFYCTLSSIEVHGVDAVERMLEDLISVPVGHHTTGGPVGDQELVSPPSESADHNNPDRDLPNESKPDPALEGSSMKTQPSINSVPDPAEEVRQQHFSRMPGDTVLKILMQKVRALDLNLSVLERYLEELNSRYASMLEELDKEMGDRDLLLTNIKSDIKDFLGGKEAIIKDVDELMSWKSLVSKHLDGILEDNAILRSEVGRVHENQVFMEKQGIVVFLISVIFGFVSVVILFTDIVYSVYSSKVSRKFCCMSSSWIFLLLYCITIIIILSL